PHIDLSGLGEAVYGLAELHRKAIAQAALVATPGCYPAGAILATAPLFRAGLRHRLAPAHGRDGAGARRARRIAAARRVHAAPRAAQPRTLHDGLAAAHVERADLAAAGRLPRVLRGRAVRARARRGRAPDHAHGRGLELLRRHGRRRPADEP